MDATSASAAMSGAQLFLLLPGLGFQIWALVSLAITSPKDDLAQVKYIRGIGLSLLSAIYLAGAKSYF